MTALGPLARMVVLLALLLVVNFLLPRALPGDPLSAAVGGSGEDLPLPLTPEARAQLVDYYGFDRSLPEQFARYASALARGDLGASIASGRPVSSLIAARIPWSLLLGGSALVLAATLGALFGVRAAWAGGAGERALTGVLVFLGALPEFVIGLVLVVAFAVALPLFPARGATSPFIECAGPSGLLRCAADAAAHLALPLLTLTLAHLPGFYLVMRAATLAQLPQGYIAAARAKGLSERQVALRHAARNALVPFLALFGARLGFVLGGVIVVESVFAYPGLGQLAFDAVLARDYPVLQAVFLLAGAAVVLGNAAADLAIERLDPRLSAVRLS
ncbi:MAG: ABC transporter permease [Candidatus Limnocylindria bacterium]